MRGLARIGITILVVAGYPLAAQCRLCAAPVASQSAPAARPLSVEVETTLDFSRAAARGGGGSIDLDSNTGVRRVTGLTDLGGIGIRGRVSVHGEPFRRIRIDLPEEVQLLAPDGSQAEATELRLSLPQVTSLDASGELTVDFGGRLVVPPGAAGEFRGRIPIRVDYE